MTETRNRSLALVVLADAVLTHAYVFVANGLISAVEWRHAPATYWLTQPWVYRLIAPVAVVACWRGVRQVLGAWAGHPRWWRLTGEGAAIGAGCMMLITLPGGSSADSASAVRDMMLLSAGLGLVLTCANVSLAHLLRPRLHPA